MFLLNFVTVCLIISTMGVESQKKEESAWILVADPIQNHTWWMRGMQMKGEETIWELNQKQNVTVLKIKIFENETSSKYAELTTQITSKDKFNLDSYEATSSFTFTFFEMSRIAKQWKQNDVSLSIIINKGDLVLTGSDFYFLIKLKDQFTVNFGPILVLMVILLVKTQITFEKRGRFTGPSTIIPGILIYFLIFSKGFLLSSQDLIFNSPWEYAKYATYSISFYIWFPYVVSIYKLFFKATLFRWRDQYWKTVSISLLATILSSYAIFVEMNQISFLLIFSVETALPKTPDSKKDENIVLKILFFVDVFVLFYLLNWPLYPGRHIFIHSSWKIAVIFIMIFETINFLFKKSKVELSLNQPSKKKKNKEQKKQ